ncbi:MAG: hypothetical protein ACTHNK_03425, partial [Thermomicrobiales bacterium]
SLSPHALLLGPPPAGPTIDHDAWRARTTQYRAGSNGGAGFAAECLPAGAMLSRYGWRTVP